MLIVQNWDIVWNRSLLSFMRNVSLSCGPVLFWTLGSAVSLLAGVQEWKHCTLPASIYNVLCVYVVCIGVWACLCVCIHSVYGGVYVCVRAYVCVPMCAVRRKWLCLFKLSTLSHVGQFSGNENPAPPSLHCFPPPTLPQSFLNGQLSFEGWGVVWEVGVEVEQKWRRRAG